MTFQNKANTSSVASSAKLFFSNVLSPALKKQSNSSYINFSSKLANNSKLTSDKHKKYLKYNLCLYYSTGDYKLDSYSKKQTTVTPKGHSISVATNSLAAVSEKSLEK